MLGVVGRLMWMVRMLPRYTSRTKSLGKKTLAVRDAVQNAVEPDTLLFESLPKALGMGPLGRSISERRIEQVCRRPCASGSRAPDSVRLG